MLTDETHARTLLAMYQAWFGGPVVMFREKPIDGRKRLAAWRALGFSKPPLRSRRRASAAPPDSCAQRSTTNAPPRFSRAWSTTTGYPRRCYFRSTCARRL